MLSEYVPYSLGENNILSQQYCPVFWNYSEKEKVFGDEENKILNGIIEKNIVETKNNFFDYYD